MRRRKRTEAWAGWLDATATDKLPLLLCDTPCCSGDGESVTCREGISVTRSWAHPAPPHDGEEVLGPTQFPERWVRPVQRDRQTCAVGEELGPTSLVAQGGRRGPGPGQQGGPEPRPPSPALWHSSSLASSGICPALGRTRAGPAWDLGSGTHNAFSTYCTSSCSGPGTASRGVGTGGTVAPRQTKATPTLTRRTI